MISRGARGLSTVGGTEPLSRQFRRAVLKGRKRSDQVCRSTCREASALCRTCGDQSTEVSGQSSENFCHLRPPEHTLPDRCPVRQVRDSCDWSYRRKQDSNVTEETSLFFKQVGVATERESARQDPTAPRSDQATPPLVVLDMGEASREQGFRENGCR